MAYNASIRFQLVLFDSKKPTYVLSEFHWFSTIKRIFVTSIYHIATRWNSENKGMFIHVGIKRLGKFYHHWGKRSITN